MATVRYLELAGWFVDPNHDADALAILHKDGKVVCVIRRRTVVEVTGCEVSAQVVDGETMRAAVAAADAIQVIN